MADSSYHWLQGKRVLITRPAAQANGLIKAVEAQGGIGILCPTLAIERLPENASNKQKILNLDGYDALIVVSRNAAQMGLAWIENYWPQLPAHLSWFAVGKSTAASLNSEGIKARVPAAGFNSEALLALPELQDLDNQRILILKGEGGRELLEQSLVERGARVDALPLYQRVTERYSPEQLEKLFADGAPDALIATSVDVLNAMDTLLKLSLENRFELPLVVASERIADAAQVLGYRHVITSSGAADDSIVSALNVIG